MSTSKTPNRLIADDDDDMPVATVDAKAAGEPALAVRPRKRRSRDPSKSAYPGRHQIVAYVERPLFLWLKSISAQTDKPMLSLFEEALVQYVNTYAAQKKFNG